MAGREDKREGRCATPAVTGKASKRKAEHSTEAPASSDGEAHAAPIGLDLGTRVKLLLEKSKREHEETLALHLKIYEDLEKEGEIEFDDEANTDDEASMIEFNE